MNRGSKAWGMVAALLLALAVLAVLIGLYRLALPY